MTAQQHASNFILGLDPRYGILRVGKALMEAASRDPEVARLFDAIQSKLGDDQSVVHEPHSAMFDRLKVPQAIPDIPTAPEWVRPLIAAGYLKARSSIGSRRVARILADPAKALEKVLSLTGELESDFLGELLVETTLAAREDPEFARTLSDGAREFRALVDELYGDASNGHEALAAAQPGLGASGSGSCTACRTVGGRRQCTPISCWVIVIIVIVIIVVK